jgi:hypothetical protein
MEKQISRLRCEMLGFLMESEKAIFSTAPRQKLSRHVADESVKESAAYRPHRDEGYMLRS